MLGKVVGFEQLDNLTTAKPFQFVPAAADAVEFSVEGGVVRYRLDGDAPTTVLGMRAGETMIPFVYLDPKRMVFIGEDPGVKVNATFFQL